jgi:hypothetical protein
MGREESVVREWGFLLVARMGRARGLCARMGFFVGCKSGERKRALGEKDAVVGCQIGIFMARGTHSAIIKKMLPKRLE